MEKQPNLELAGSTAQEPHLFGFDEYKVFAAREQSPSNVSVVRRSARAG